MEGVLEITCRAVRILGRSMDTLEDAETELTTAGPQNTKPPNPV